MPVSDTPTQEEPVYEDEEDEEDEEVVEDDCDRAFDAWRDDSVFGNQD